MASSYNQYSAGSNYTTIGETDFSGGIDAATPENATPENYLEDAINAIPTYDGLLRKRPGYVTYGGGIPIPVSRIEAVDATTFRIYLPTHVSPIAARNTPVVLTGRLSNTSEAAFPSGFGTEFNSTAIETHYYPATVSNPRRSVGANSTSTVSILAAESGLTTRTALVQVTECSQTSNDNSHIMQEVTVNTSTFEITASISNQTDTAKSFFIQVLDTATSPLQSFYKDFFAPALVWTIPRTGVGGHGLPNNNILVRCYDIVGAELVPDSIIIAVTGDVTATFLDNGGSAPRGRMVLVAAEPSHVKFDTAAPASVTTVVLPVLETPWVFADCYLDNAGERSRIIPDSVTVDAATLLATVSFTNTTSSSQTFYIFWTCVDLGASTTVIVAGAGMTTGAFDNAPQLTLYGVDHETAYINGGSRAGWVQHVDSYTTEAEQRMVCGLGGDIYAYYDASEAGASLLMGSWYPNLRSRTDIVDKIIGPCFTSAISTRTRGYIKADEVNADGQLFASSTTWDAAVAGGSFRLDFPATNLTESGIPFDTLETSPGSADILTISQSPYTELLGDFVIAKYTTTPTSLSVWIMPTTASQALAFSEFDTTGVQLLCGVFSDILAFGSMPPFVPGDILNSTAFPTGMLPTVLSAPSTTTLRLSGITIGVFVPLGLLVAATRPAARVVALRDSADVIPTDTLLNIVRGDMLSIPGLIREVRCTRVHAAANRTVSVTNVGTTATLTSGDLLTDFSPGDSFILLGGVFSGIWEVDQVLSDMSLTFTCSILASSVTMQLAGAVIEFDEAIPSLSDTDDNTAQIYVTSRWAAVEAPTTDADVGSRTYPSYFPSNAYDEQPIIKSVTASDNMYFTNGQDDVMKYDGANIYTAGLPRWQAQMFVALDTDVVGTPNTARIPLQTVAAASVAAIAGGITVAPTSASGFLIGDIVADGAGNFSKVTAKKEDPAGTANATISLEGSIPLVHPVTISLVYKYRYYFRLNAVDAQGNVVASATTGVDDALVSLIGPTAVKFKLMGMPSFAAYDYARIELEVYRTKGRFGTGTYYRTHNVDVSFAASSGYLYVTDVTDDSILSSEDVDRVMTGINVSTAPALEPPPIAKCITSFGDRLLLGNIKSKKNINFRLIEPVSGNSTAAGFNNYNFIFKKDSASSVGSTNMTGTIVFGFVAAPKLNITNITTADGITATVACTIIGGDLAYELSQGNWVYLTNTTYGTVPNLTYAGWHQVISVGFTTNAKRPTSFTFKQNGMTAGAVWDGVNNPDIVCISQYNDVPVYLGADANFGAFQGNSTAATIPFMTDILMKRLGLAINATQRAVNTSLSAYTSFVPWLSAGSGGDYASGELQVTHIGNPAVNPVGRGSEGAASGGGRLYVNGNRDAASDYSSFVRHVFPSRVVMSYRKYPEMFADPFTTGTSDSVMDINPDDGQVITGIMPMFGTSAFTLSQRGGTLLVFKERSVYVVSIDEKAAGRAYAQRLETNGVGCTMPGSIAQVLNGIAFANETGIYRVNQDLKVELLSYKLDGRYQKFINNSYGTLDLFQGHHYAKEQQFKLSFPAAGAELNDGVWVYNYRREDKGQGKGGWCSYTTFPATMWCNQRTDEFFGCTKGRVFKTRNDSQLSDFRDDCAAITATATLRAMDFGDAAIRKQCKHVLLSFRNSTANLTGTAVYAAINLDKQNFRQCEPFTQRLFADRAVDSLRFGMPAGRFTYLQIKVVNGTIDEPMELSGASYRVTGLSTQRTTEAKH